MKLTKRGKRARALLIVAGLALIYYLATHINWAGEGFCWGTINECLLERGK